MAKKFERTAVLLILAVSPFWLPSFPERLGSSMRSTLTEWLKGPLEVFQTAQGGWSHLGSGLLEWMWVHEENRLFRGELEALRAHEQTHLDLFLENVRLRRLIEFRERSPWAMIPAEVIGREMGPGSRTLLLDKGSAEGLRSGMAVITPAGLVGRVGDVGPTSCRVFLVTDPHFRVAAVLLTRRVFGLVTGGGAGESLMTYLPLDLNPTEGEAVLTSGGRSFCPDGIPVGAIRKVWADRSQLFKTATLQPAVDLQTVEEVLVVGWRPSASARSS